MRIGIICHPSIGGSGLVATELGLKLAALGHEIHFISYQMPFRLDKQRHNVFFHPVKAIHYPLFNDNLYTFALTAKIAEIADQYALEIVHAHYSIPHSLCAHLAREIAKNDFKIVTTIHGTDVTVVGRDQTLYPLNRFSIEQSDLVTTVSNFQRQHTKKHFQLEREILVIHNFIDTDVFSPTNTSRELRRQMANDDEKIIMHVSNFRKPKNTLGVIKAYAKAAGRINARLVLAGDGPDVETCRSLCHTLGITEQVVYLGKVTRLENHIPNVDCVLQPSYRESFGMVLLEAMSCEVPTISSNNDGIPEVVNHGETGYMADADNHDQLAEYLVEICSDTQLQRRLGIQGRERVFERFHWKSRVQDYLHAYDRCLGRGI